MTNWKTYKGEGPWEFARSQSEAKYNIGNAIKDLGDQVWSLEDNGLKGNPITPTHHPNCGMWNGLEAPGYPSAPPIIPVPVPVSLFITLVAWTPNAGGAFGRFVGIVSPPYVAQIIVYYSDNGGYNWTIASTSLTGINNTAFTLTHIKEKDIFIVTGYTGFVSSWTATSQDGINWTMGTPMAYLTNGVISGIDWYSYANLYTGFASIGGGTSYLYTSSDGLLWTQRISMGLFATYKVAHLNNILYALSYNYSYFYKFLDIPPIAPPTAIALAGAEIPPTYLNREELIHNDEILVYNGAYYDGSIWTANSNLATKLDYNPLSDLNSHAPLFASSHSSKSRMLSFSRDGKSWIDAVVSASFTPQDLAVGYERVVSTTFTTEVIVTTIS